MRVTVRIPLFWASLLALAFVGVIACVVAWFILLSTICSSPRAPVPETQHVNMYSCHGMKVFISPLQKFGLEWLGPIGLVLGFVAFVAGAKVAHAAASTAQRATRRRVRIVAVPPGDAPEWVREKWVGLELPLAQWSAAPIREKVAGVLSGEHTQHSGFRVDVVQALAVLEASSPDAAQWWRTHAAHLVKPSRFFLFSENVCEVIH